MMRSIVLDSYAVIAFLEGERGADQVRELIWQAEQGKVKLLMNMINLGEVWYAIARATNPETAEAYTEQIQGMSIEMVVADWEVTHQAAIYKAGGNISYADCFAAATCRLHQSELMTGDPEFRLLEKDIKIIWLN